MGCKQHMACRFKLLQFLFNCYFLKKWFRFLLEMIQFKLICLNEFINRESLTKIMIKNLKCDSEAGQETKSRTFLENRKWYVHCTIEINN